MKFYWKGKAYDNPFDFQDRLQQLYKVGMDKFLGDEITYIANDRIDEAFDIFKNKPNATKDKIKDLVRQLKFFTNNDFAFIDVHNEKLFYQNFDVFLKITKMIQDIKLTGSEENQFLGDMFESFLDQGVKQSEGQFFTPMPIVKFIINSLPKKQNPKVIDYACGAGHFLNEYSTLHKDSQIVGVEKEYRLSKVAKVSSFMYGSDMEIIYSDALAKNEKLKDDSFDVLIANPPYSVKGFLQTLSEEDRNNYELINTVDSKSYSKTGAIECFFMERAKQLLKKDAVVGIVVPSSILNKDTPKLYTHTREIILKYFDIVAICEFGSGTFGKTGTSTVTLFLRKRGNNPELYVHYKNMVNSWFENDFTSNEAFKDSKLLEKYCNHIELDFEVYKTLLVENLDDKVFENETFKEYRTSFEKSTTTKQRKTKKTYKELTKEKKEELEKKELVKFIKEIEKDKLLYFMLASKQENDVLILIAPLKGKSNNKKVDPKFLGYDWSGRKGSEGIKYFSSESIEIEENNDEEELDIDDKRVIENLQGLKHINTPLYNPQNLEDENKINKIIKDNFSNIKTPIVEELKEFVNRARLVDMMDFSRVDFNKAWSLTPIKKIEIESKYTLEKLGLIAEIKKGKTITEKDAKIGEIKVVAGGINFAYYHNESNRLKNIMTISASGANAGYINYWKEEIFASDCSTIYIENEITSLFVYNILKINQELLFDLARGSAQPHVYPKDIENFKIPYPPIEIQEKVVKECEIVDTEVKESNETIHALQQSIKDDFNMLYTKADNSFRLSDEKLFDIFIGKRVLSKDIEDKQTDKTITVYSANVYEPFGYIKVFFIQDFSIASVLWGIDGDWMVNHISPNKPFYPTDHCGVLRVKTDKINPRYLKFALEKEGIEKRFSRTYRASTDRIKALSIKAPSIEEQNKFVKKLEESEIQIIKAQKIIDNIKVNKEKILKKYL